MRQLFTALSAGSTASAVLDRRGTKVLSMLALMSGVSGVWAQDTVPTQSVNEVVVTGSRIVRDGYDAPTPLTVVSSEQMQEQASPNLIDYMTSLPSFAGNYTPQSSTQNLSTGTAGTSSVNLRNLGTNRTLVLINGQRSVPSTITGLVDVNTVPKQLIERVEVVTGGASAAYGSDAVSGVVNFILDTDFSGFKAEASGGMTDYSDNGNYSVSMTLGSAFAGGRGHIVFSGEHTQVDGVLVADREWNNRGWQIINNPAYTATNGQPRRLLLPQIAASNAAPGGMIVSGPMRGVIFGEGGVPAPFTYGQLISGIAMQGGDWKLTSLHNDGQSLAPKIGSDNVFARASYELTDSVEAYIQTNWYTNNNYSHAYPNEIYFGGLNVSVDNPFMPATIAAQARGHGLTSIEMGSWFKDLGTIAIDTSRELLRNVVGLNGQVDLFGTNWTWDAYYQHGVSKSKETGVNSAYMSRLDQALNAVVDPQTGAIVCASSLITPGNGCVPFNPFGIGVNSQQAIEYAAGTVSWRRQRFEQEVVAASVSGTPWQNWAGPVSVAFGLEHRQESVSGISSAEDMAGVFFAGNYRPTKGKYNVTEGFVETVFPLLNDKPWARSMDLNLAARFTDYSVSGSVETWKAGLTYAPVDDLRLRLTVSRDIRAPNLGDLFNAGTRVSQNVIDNTTGNAVQTENTTTGNLNLQPEKADSLGIGLVFQPSFVPGFSASVDYWEIDLEDAINTVSAQRIVDLCQAGNQTFCGAINDGQPLRPTAGSTARNTISIQPFNLARQRVKGVDIEAGYRLPMSVLGGELSTRVLASHYIENYRDDTLTAPTDTAGENYGGGPPDWRYSASLNYQREALALGLRARGVSSGVYGNSFIECQTDCPAATIEHPTININKLKGALYLDLSASYTFYLGEQAQLQTFLNVSNLANKDPVIAVGGPSGLPYDTVSTVPNNYDSLGRTYLAGVRVKL